MTPALMMTLATPSLMRTTGQTSLNSILRHRIHRKQQPPTLTKVNRHRRKDHEDISYLLCFIAMLTGYDDTSFYQDTVYDPYDDAANATLYGDALVTNHQPKKTKPLYVNYARTAKRVDVKRLKENLWASLEKQKDAETSAITELVEGTQRFTDVLRRLRKRYSEKTFKDISVPFCFICLLHLANERNLTIARSGEAEDPDDFVLGDTMMDEDFLNEVTITQN